MPAVTRVLSIRTERYIGYLPLVFETGNLLFTLPLYNSNSVATGYSKVRGIPAEENVTHSRLRRHSLDWHEPTPLPLPHLYSGPKCRDQMSPVGTESDCPSCSMQFHACDCLAAGPPVPHV